MGTDGTGRLAGMSKRPEGTYLGTKEEQHLPSVSPRSCCRPLSLCSSAVPEGEEVMCFLNRYRVGLSPEASGFPSWQALVLKALSPRLMNITAHN